MSNIQKLTDQILGQNTTDKWSGQGFGSAQANAADMAKILDGIGITDIRQFGQFDIPADEEVTPVYSYTSQDYGGETGVVTTRGGIIGYKDSKGNNVDSNLVKTGSIFKDYGDSSGYFDVPVAPVGTKNVFGNKETGQAVPVTYGERQTGNSFGGTFAGDGNTGYRVQFSPDGTPVFYTTGASSKDSALTDLAPILGLGLMFVPGLQGAGAALGSALGASGAFATGLGNAIIQGTLAEATGGDFLKGAALSGLGSVAGGFIQPGLTEALGGGAAANIGSSALVGGAMSELSGGDFVKGALLSGIGSGINQAKLSLADDYINSVEPGIGYDPATSPTELDVIAAYPELASLPIFNAPFNPEFNLTQPNVDYSLFSDVPALSEMGAQGIQVPTINEIIDVVDQPVNYNFPVFNDGLGFEFISNPNLIDMGGGQGLTIPFSELPPYIAPDTSFVPDYGLNVSAPVISDMGAQGIQVGEIADVVDVNQPVDYSLTIPESGLGLVMPTAPNLDSMDGGQGLVIPVDGGVITEDGFIPDTYIPPLGDIESFINQPAPNVDVTIPELLPDPPNDISKELSALNVAKTLAPLVVGAITAENVVNAISEDEPTGYPILPIPSDWTSPGYSTSFTQSAPIDFGSQDLLQGTQWANMGQPLPTPNQYNLSDVINTLNYQSVPFVQQQYQMPEQSFDVPGTLQQFQTKPTFGMNDIVGNLNGSQVSISDIIAGIQSQYG